jgi:hypothetical protein
MNDDLDSPWKEFLADYFQEFIAFLFPTAHAGIDWDRGVEFLDGELQQIAVESETGRKSTDKLAKVFTIEGNETWCLIHTEIQGYFEPDFSERMFVMNYRLFDKYRVDVVSFAVFTDARKSFSPDHYRRELWGCEVDFRYPVAKIVDWKDRWSELRLSTNPFALVLMAQIRATESKDGQQRKAWKLELIQLMYERGFARSDVLALFRVIDWMLRLPTELELEFRTEVQRIEKIKKMPYITSIERLGFQDGFHDGFHDGEKKGGAKVLARLLQIKFGTLGPEVESRLEQAVEDQLLGWTERVLTAKTLSEIFE